MQIRMHPPVLAFLLALGLMACTGENQPGDNQTPGNQTEEDAGDDQDTTDPSDADNAQTNQSEQDAELDVEEEDPLEFPDVDPVECAYPTTDPECEPGDFGPGSFVTRLHIVGDTSCCADLTGDGEINNLMGTLLGALETVEGFEDVNGEIQTSINDGQLAYLLEAAHWNHPEFDPSVDLFLHEARATQATMEDNLAGQGNFLLAPWSIVDGTDVRRFGFESAYVYEGVLYAEGGVFQIRFPGLVENIDARMEKISLVASVVQDPAPDLTAGGGFGLREGRMGGAIIRDALFESLNEAALDCECMGEDVVFYFYEGGTADRWHCGLKVEDEAACVDGTVECRALAQRQLCVSLAALSPLADVVVDGERAFSVGLSISSVPTEILGVHE
jgi:hypothetical protein